MTQLEIYKALKAFIGTFCNWPVIQGLQNGAVMPKVPFILMQETGRKRLATNLRRYYAEGEDELQESTLSQEVSMQIDIYGDGSADVAAQFETLFRDYIATDFFPRDIAPLYLDDFRQIQLIDTEKCYNQRWTSTIKFNILTSTKSKIKFIHDVQTYLFPQT